MAKIYWRRIKAGTRFFADVPGEALKDEVKVLAKQDVVDGIISAEQYYKLIGEEYIVSE